MDGLILALLAAIAVAGYVIRVYNGLIRKLNHADEAFSGIDVQLKKRAGGW